MNRLHESSQHWRATTLSVSHIFPQGSSERAKEVNFIDISVAEKWLSKRSIAEQFKVARVDEKSPLPRGARDVSFPKDI